MEDSLPPLISVLVQEGHISHPGVRVKVGGHGPGLTSSTQSHPEVCSEGAIEEPGLEAAWHGGRVPQSEARERLLGPGELLGEVGCDPGGDNSLWHKVHLVHIVVHKVHYLVHIVNIVYLSSKVKYT